MGKIKVGDRLKCIDFMEDTDEENFTIGDKYTVIKINEEHQIDLVVINDHGRDWHTFIECFELVKKYNGPPKNEVEWMNRVQENFSED